MDRLKNIANYELNTDGKDRQHNISRLVIHTDLERITFIKKIRVLFDGMKWGTGVRYLYCSMIVQSHLCHSCHSCALCDSYLFSCNNPSDVVVLKTPTVWRFVKLQFFSYMEGRYKGAILVLIICADRIVYTLVWKITILHLNY